MTEVKICGITTCEEAVWLMEEKAEYAGIVLFYEKSRRFNTVENAYKILRVIKNNQNKGNIKTVAVVVSPTPEQIAVIQKLEFDYIQIHGALEKESFDEVTIPIIRAINGEQYDDLDRFLACKKIAAILFDAKEAGSGTVADWSRLASYAKQIREHDKKCMLAGGLHVQNVAEAIRCVGPDVVDVSSGVEKDAPEKGKDQEKIKKFIGEVRANE